MSVASLRAALGALDITGMNRRYANKPLDLNPSDLPAQWVGAITQDVEQLTFTVKEPVYSATFNVVVRPVVMGDSAGNETLADVDTLVGNLNTVFHAPEVVTGFDIREIDIEPSVLDVNGTEYDGLIVTISAR